MNKQIATVCIATVVLFFASSAVAKADTEIYISISIGGGAVIGMVGYFLHISLSTRVAEEKKEKKPVQTVKTAPSLQTRVQADFFSPRFDRPFKNTPQGSSTPFEIYFLTYRW